MVERLVLPAFSSQLLLLDGAPVSGAEPIDQAARIPSALRYDLASKRPPVFGAERSGRPPRARVLADTRWLRRVRHDPAQNRSIRLEERRALRGASSQGELS